MREREREKEGNDFVRVSFLFRSPFDHLLFLPLALFLKRLPGCWELVVLSKNGVMLNGVNLQPPLRKDEGDGVEKDNGGGGDEGGATKPPPAAAATATAIARLASGDTLSVGDREFSFLLPSKRAAVLTTEGVLEPGWLLGGASGKTAAAVGGGGGVASPGPAPPAVTAAAAAADPAAAAADPAAAAAPGVPGSRPETAQTRSVEREAEEAKEEEEEKDGEEGGDKGKG